MSQHIQLFPENKTTKEIIDNRLDLARPEKLNFSQGHVTSQKWVECKILGKNISIRSYAAACGYNSELYVYGGFQILNGILSDFHKIDLDANQTKFQWRQVQVKNKKQSPGPRARHALINYKKKIYLIGGIKSTYEVSNEIFQFNIEQNTWLRLQPKGIKLPNLQSFGNTIINDRIILMCGYNGKTCQYTNDVYQYNITTNTISALYLSHNNKNQPQRRSGCAIASDGKNIFMFGGKEQQNRFNDLWLFNLDTKQYSRIQDKAELRPFIRNGHSMNYYQDRLYIFGGIHEVTWELNDLYIFHIKKNQWTTLELDSARRKQKKLSSLTHQHIQQVQRHSQANNKHHNTILHKHQLSPSSKKDPILHFKQQSLQGGYHHPPNSPGKMIDEQRKKAFYLKKSEMLKQFQIQEKQKQRYINVQPTSQAMQNSLDFIGNPSSKVKLFGHDKLTQFGKTSCSKFLLPLSNNSNIVPGKKPCARDGHCSVLINNQLIIFGGDRHQMSFNDLFKLNMSVVKTILQNAH